MHVYVQLYVQEVISCCSSRRTGGIARAIFWGRERSKRVVAKPQRQFSISTEQVSQQVRTNIFHSSSTSQFYKQQEGKCSVHEQAQIMFLYCYMLPNFNRESFKKKKLIVVSICVLYILNDFAYHFSYFD